jgi:hypothetical protein
VVKRKNQGNGGKLRDDGGEGWFIVVRLETTWLVSGILDGIGGRRW